MTGTGAACDTLTSCPPPAANEIRTLPCRALLVGDAINLANPVPLDCAPETRLMKPVAGAAARPPPAVVDTRTSRSPPAGASWNEGGFTEYEHVGTTGFPPPLPVSPPPPPPPPPPPDGGCGVPGPGGVGGG